MVDTLKPLLITIEKLFHNNQRYYIPDYQRSYSWAEPQLEQWLKDLQEIANIPDLQYYLGRILLEKNNDKFAVIDGQQRLTTILLFFSAAVQFRKKSSVLTFKQLSEYCNQFELGGTDKEFFKKLICNESVTTVRTKSQAKLLNAKKYFLDKFKTKSYDDVELCKILLGTAILVQPIADKRMATLIFQLENDRGINLTNLEKLKSYLMYELLLQISKEGIGENDQNVKLKEVSDIFNEIGKISFNIKESPTVILEAHYRSFITPQANPFRKYSIEKIQEYIRNYSEDRTKIIDHIICFAKGLLKSFQAVKNLENKRDNVFQNTLKYLDIPTYAWPFLLIEAKRNSFSNRERLGRLLVIMGNLILRHEMVIYLHSARVTNIIKNEYLGKILWAFREDQDIDELEESLIDGFEKSWKAKGLRGKKGLIWSKDKYNEALEDGYYTTRLVKFFLMQYERELGSELNPKLDWTVEHISPQSKRAINDAADYGYYAHNENEASELVDEDYIGWIGNLCLLERRPNSEASNRPFNEKLKVYQKSKLAQAKEVKDFASVKSTYWDIDAIKKRYNRLIKFIKKYKQDGRTNSFTIFD